VKVINSGEVEPRLVEEEGAKGTTVRWLISRPEGAPSFAMRVFEMAPGGSTPFHDHVWEHEVYVLTGEAEVVSEAGPRPISEGDAVLVEPEEKHQFRNVGDGRVKFLCMIPLPEEP
jgi:quercetin dioxygenase-like cupin family protein